MPRARRSSILAAILFVSGVVTSVTSLAADDAAKKGWHGEIMPPGLERGAKEGEYVCTQDGSIMVYVPAGTFLMGSDDYAANEKPAHEVLLDAYYIDKYEVSWKDWKASGLHWTERTGTREPIPEAPDWGIIDDHPMLNVNWDDAQQYLKRLGKRLPTEAEWEKAARGTDGRKFPWGNEPPTPERAVWDGHPIATESTAPVTCCEAGASPYGAINMAGNAMEWCADYYHGQFYHQAPRENPVNKAKGAPFRVLRGGAFVLRADEMRNSNRYRSQGFERLPYIGFRGVMSAASAATDGSGEKPPEP